MRYWSLFIGLGLVACETDGSLKVQTSPPVVTIQQPTDGAELQQGDFLQLRGLIQDSAYEEDLTQIQVSWAVGGTTVCEGSVVDLGGNTTCDYDFSEAGEITIDLQAISPEATGSASSTITVISNFPPEAEIITPNGTVNYYSDQLVAFDGIVSDAETATTDLSGHWTSSIDGELDISTTPDEDGHVQGEELLSEGTHTITFTAVESETRQGSDTITIEVGGANQLPTCGINSPISGETYSAGEIIEFSGQADDPDIPASELMAEWRSNVDGVLSETPVNSDGTFSTGIDYLENGPHTITLSVYDEVGGICTDSIDIVISSRPTVVITAPTANEIFNESARVDFQAEVSDIQDQPQDLLLDWSSSIDGTFSTQSATSNGVAIANTYLLTPGTHIVELTVTDTDGYSSTDQVAIQINALPTSPEISLTPDPITSSDDISVNIDIPSVDPEGDPITYSYQWTKNTQPTTHTGATIPFSDTLRGDLWEVYVTPNDGYGDGGMVSASVTIINSPPLITAASLSLSSLLETDTLTCSPVGEYDEDGDTISFTYDWLVNGASVSSSDSIDGSLFSRGDTVQCQITPSDGNSNGTGATISSTTLTVENSVPTYTGAELTPTTAYESDTLTCAGLNPNDDDGDTVTPIYAWNINGLVIAATSETLAGTYFDKGDAVTCTVTPNDGIDNGATQTSNTVTIENTAPELGTVNLTPLSSYENSTLVCTPQAGTYSDDDGDSISFTYDWLINGSPTGLGSNTISGSDFDKNDTVACVATPNDGTISGDAVTSNEITIQNTPPTISGATLSSPTSDVTGDLTCTAGTTNDIDPADTVVISYEWTIGGVTVPNQITSVLPSSELTRGDVVACIITPNDNDEDGTPAISNSISIINTAPEYSGAELNPNPAYEADILTCEGLNPYDADSGDTVSPTYAWYVGTSTIPIGVSTQTLNGSYFNKGDAVYCTVTPNDGISSGQTVTSNSITIWNTAPDLTDTDLAPLVSFESSTLTCTPRSGTYSDDDGDPITFSYDWLISGSPIGVNSNTINGSNFDKNNTVACVATPNDGSVDGPEVMSNEITIQNTPPTISGATLSSPTSDVTGDLTCTAGTTADTDPSDTVTVSYAWTIGGSTVSNQTTNILAGSEVQRGDVVTCIVTPNDGDDNGTPAVSNSITINNTAPEYSGAELTPNTAYEATTLTCTGLNPADADSDTVSPIYAWFVGGGSTGVTSQTLTGSHFNKGDSVFCTVTPDDGIDTGVTHTSNSITIDNTAPDLGSVDLAPSTSYENSTLTCTPQAGTYSDDDGDSISFSYAWTKNGSPLSQTTSTLTGTAFNKTDVISCTVTPHDGTESGSSVGSNSLTIQNTPPTITGTSISSPTGDVTSAITCTAGTTNDIDPADSVTVSYSWTKNGSAISGQTNSTLQPSNFSNGDSIVCIVTPNDGTDNGTAQSSAALAIGNATPSYTNPSLTPSTAYETSTLTCTPGSSADPDGDTVTPIYGWYRNGSVLSGITSATLSGSYFDKGDSIYCSTIPTDGTNQGTEVSSGSVTIQNSTPTANTPSISPTNAYETTTFTCSANGGSDSDPSDSVSFSYGWKVDGQTIGQTGTTLNGSYFDKGNVVKCFVTPSDGTITGTSVESTGVTVNNSTPSFTNISISPTNPQTGESISSSPSGWTDADGDSEGYTYQWYNQNGAINNANGASLSSGNTSKGDVIYLQATAYDGVASGVTRTSSSITVVNTAPEAPTVQVQPTNAEPEDNLTCVITSGSYDADGDSITYSYQWYQNGGHQTALTTNTVGSSYTNHNDQWVCVATPFDGTDSGATASDSQVVADVTDPSAPLLNSIDAYRNEGSVIINGTAEADSTLQLYNSCGSNPAAIIVPSSGSFSIVVTINSGDFCEYYATATDAAGNTSSNSNTIDTEYCNPVDSYEISGAFGGDSCNDSIDVLNILAPSSSSSVETITGNIITPGDEDWYVVDTSSNVGSSGINYYNFQVELTTGSTFYDITVYRGDCTSGSLQTSSAGATSYDTYNYYAYDDGDGTNHLTPSDSRYCQSNSRYDTCDDLSSTYYIKVHRVDGQVDCEEYTLSIQNGY